MTETELEELLFEVCQTTTLARLVEQGKLVFNVDDYCEAWHEGMHLRPPTDVLIQQIESSRHTMPAPFDGSWCIRPGSIQTLRDWSVDYPQDWPG